MKVAVLKYDAGNTASVANALRRLGIEPAITDDAEKLRAAEKVIFPGVGEASTAMRYLRERDLDRVLSSLIQPVLGICLGMQLMCGFSEENETECLGIFPGRARRFLPGDLKVPHTGWNQITSLRPPLFEGVAEGSWVYFVHGYYVDSGPDTIAESEYGLKFSAAIERDNFFAVQFHPEKSADVGAQILKNFLSL